MLVKKKLTSTKYSASQTLNDLFVTTKGNATTNSKETCTITAHSWLQYCKRCLLLNNSLEPKLKDKIKSIVDKYNGDNAYLIKKKEKEVWNTVCELIRKDLIRCIEFVHCNNVVAAKSLIAHKMQKATYFSCKSNNKNNPVFVISNNKLVTVHLNESHRWIPKNNLNHT